MKSDVLAIHNATKGVLAKTGDLQVPSWRFPEKLSTSVDVEALLKDLRYTASHDNDCAAHMLLLELTIDRLLLLLQAYLQLSGRSRTSGPSLTLQSSVKKFAKKVLQDVAESPTSKSQVLTGAQGELLNAACRDASAQKAISSQPMVQQASVACQTVDTAFATCAKCYDLQHSLVNASSLVEHLCKASGTSTSAMATTDWKSLAALGGLSPSKWEAALVRDLATVEDYCTFAEQTCQKLSEDLSAREQRIVAMEADVKVLSAQVNTLQANVEDMKVKGDLALTKSREGFEVQLKEAEQAKEEEKKRVALLTSELESARLQVAQLKIHISQLG